jgi:hypothetical protein
MKTVRLLAVIVVAIAVSNVSAGTVEQATILADPQMQVKQGAVQGCGYRLKALPKSFSGQTSFVALDVSFNLYSPGLGLLKGGALQIAIKDGNFQSANRQAENFWMKVEGGKPTAPVDGKVLPSETKGFLLYAISGDAIAKLFAGIAAGAPMTIGVRIKGESIDRIYSGAVQLSDLDRKQGGQCLSDLIKEMEAGSSGAGPSR